MEEKQTPPSGLSNSDPRFFESAPLALQQDNQVIVNVWSSAENKAVPGVNVGHVSIETPNRYISLWPGPHQGLRPVAKSALHGVVLGVLSTMKTRPPSWKASYLEDCVLEALAEGHYREVDNPGQCSPHEQTVAVSEDHGLVILAAGAPVPLGARLLAVTHAPANVRLPLYGLSIGKMETQFDQIQNTVSGWRLIGSNCLSRTLNSTSQENCASLAYRMLNAGGMYHGSLKVRASSETASVTKPDVLIRHIMTAKQNEVQKHPETQGWTFAGASSLPALQQAYGKRGAESARDSFKKSEPSTFCSVS